MYMIWQFFNKNGENMSETTKNYIENSRQIHISSITKSGFLAASSLYEAT